MRKAVRFSNKSSLSPKQLFFLSKAQISNSTFIFGNMYSLHFAHYLRLESACKKGALSLDEEFQLLEDKLIETSQFINPNKSFTDSPLATRNSTSSSSNSDSGCSSSGSTNSLNLTSTPNSTASSNGTPPPNSPKTPTKISLERSGSNDSENSETNSIGSSNSNGSANGLDASAMHKAPSSPVPHKNSIAVCIAPGLPFLLQNFQKYSTEELRVQVENHLKKLDEICRKYNKMLIVIGYLPVYKGSFLRRDEANKINEILMTLDNSFSRHDMFKNKFIKYFQVSKVLKSPDMRKCGIYPTSNSYLLIGEKLQEFIFSLSC